VLESWEDTKSLFLLLNRAESVPEIDLPDTLAPAHKAVIDAAVLQLKTKYPGFFSTSSRCRPPNLHAPSLRAAIMKTGVVQRRRWSASALLARVERINSELSARRAQDWPTSRRGRALSKAARGGCFLGLSSAWLDELDSSS